MSNFWLRVNILLQMKEIPRKQLAIEAGFHQSNIIKGMKNGNIPSADTALKIAKVLGTSVEYLVTGEEKEIYESPEFTNKMDKYAKTIIALEAIPEDTRQCIETMIRDLSNKQKN